MITVEDMEAMGFSYYSPVEAEPNEKTFTDMVKEFAKVTGQRGSPGLYAKLIKEEYNEWLSEYWADDSPSEAELKELADLTYVIFGYANAMGYNLMEAFKRVHENNVGRCIQPDGTVHRREDGKILKNKDYPKVDLKDLV